MSVFYTINVPHETFHMKQAHKKGEKNVIGAMGEEVAAKFLVRKGMLIKQYNYLKKWGEIDLVAHETGKVHFIEVKTVSYETKEDLRWAISHETWRPEENVHYQKLKRLSRTISSWLLEHEYAGEWQFDVAVVRLVPREKYATIKMIPNVIIE